MLKRIRRAVRKNLLPVRRYASRLEADLAAEILELYQIHTLVITDYIQAKVAYLFVPRSDYYRAVKLLNYAY